MGDLGEMRAWGYTYGDIQRMKRERDRYRFALQTILFGAFGKRPPTGAALRSLVLRAWMRGGE